MRVFICMTPLYGRTPTIGRYVACTQFQRTVAATTALFYLVLTHTKATQRKCAPTKCYAILVNYARQLFLLTLYLDRCVNMLCLPVLSCRLRYSHNLFVEASERCFQRHQHTFLFLFHVTAYDRPLLSSPERFFDALAFFARVMSCQGYVHIYPISVCRRCCCWQGHVMFCTVFSSLYFKLC